MAFLIVWFVGDVTNLIGGLWAQLVPVVIAIAVYFCIADGVLIAQTIYYHIRNARREQRRSSHQSSIETPTPTTPLLGRRFSDELTIPGSRRRRSSASARGGNQHGTSYPDDTLAKIVEESDSGARVWVKNFLSVAGIFVIGAGGWAIAWQSGLWKPTPQEESGGSQMAPGAQVLGYFSAICYLGYVLLLELITQVLKFLAIGPACLRSTRTTERSLAKVRIYTWITPIGNISLIWSSQVFPCCFSSYLFWEISLTVSGYVFLVFQLAGIQSTNNI